MSQTVMCDVNGSRLSFNGYRRRPKVHEWSIKETARFYKALSTVGTDFSIMQQLFPKRTRVDLKKKFKKEERKNPHLVEHAMRQEMQYDLTIFDGDEWEDTVEKCKTAKQRLREEERIQKKEARSRDMDILRKEKASRRPPKVKAEQLPAALSAASLMDNLHAPPPPPTQPAQLSLQGHKPSIAAADAAEPPPLTALAATTDLQVLPSGAPLQLPAGFQLPAGVNPQNLLIIASQAPDRPDGQVLHVYMIQPPPGQTGADVNVTLSHAPPQPLSSLVPPADGAAGGGVDGEAVPLPQPPPPQPPPPPPVMLTVGEQQENVVAEEEGDERVADDVDEEEAEEQAEPAGGDENDIKVIASFVRPTEVAVSPPQDEMPADRTEAREGEPRGQPDSSVGDCESTEGNVDADETAALAPVRRLSQMEGTSLAETARAISAGEITVDEGTLQREAGVLITGDLASSEDEDLLEIVEDVDVTA